MNMLEIDSKLRNHVLKSVAPAIALPSVNEKYSLKPDMVLGGRPDDVRGAPIPMYYDFETFDIPVNPDTKTEYPPYYIGPRYGDSLEMHRQFANKTKAVGPDECPSYHFKFPPNQNVIDAIEHNLSRAKRAFQKTKFNAHRYFVGMNPLLVEESVDSAIRSNKI